jgi:uncharacterized protein YpbB
MQQYKLDQIEQLTQKLVALPANHNRDVSRREAVQLMARAIRGAQDKGYTLEQVASELSSGGFTISSSSLKSYLAAAKTKPKKTRAPTKSTATDHQASAGAASQTAG